MCRNFYSLLAIALCLLSLNRADAGPNHRLQTLLSAQPLRARVLFVDTVGQTVTVSTEAGRCTFDARNIEILETDRPAASSPSNILRPGRIVILESVRNQDQQGRVCVRLAESQERLATNFPPLRSGMPGSAGRPAGDHLPSARALVAAIQSRKLN